MTTSTIDKIKAEKLQFENEAADLRNKNQLLTRKLKTANDPQGLIDQICRDKKSHAFLEENIINLKGELSLRELKIEALTKELVVAHRSIEVQSKYESLTSTQSSVSNSREIMRTLYFDMGKKQADLHSVTLALAEATQRNKALDEELTQALRAKRDALQENEKLLGNVEYLGRQAVEFNDQISHLRQQLDNERSAHGDLHEQLEMTAGDFSNARVRYGEESTARQLVIEELTSATAIAEQEKEAMRQALDSATRSFKTKESVFTEREQQLQQEYASLHHSHADLQEKAQICGTLQARLEILQNNLSDSEHIRQQQEQRISELLRLLAEKEVSLNEGTANFIALDGNLVSMHAELSSVREQLQLVIAERSEAVDALRHTMRATRELSQKYHMEKEAREHVERTNQQLLQAKANLSAATLDALYQERRKSAALEKSLAMVPLVLKWRSACVPAMDVPMSERQGAQAAAEQYAQHYSSSSSAASDESVVQAGRDISAAAGDISNIVRHLDTATGLQEGVNATFDWLLSGEAAESPAAGTVKTATLTTAEAIEEQKSDAADSTQPPSTPAPTSTPPILASTPAPTDPVSALKSPSIAALMAEAYKKVELSSGVPSAAGPAARAPPAPQSMVSELQR